MKFRDEQKFVIVLTTLSGLYMPSIEKLIDNKLITTVLKYFTVIPGICMMVFISAAVKHLLWDQANFVMKAYSLGFIGGFYIFIYKAYYYNANNHRFERIFDLWDSSFSEDFFSDRRNEMFQQKKKRTHRYVKIIMSQCLCGSLLWGIPLYFIPEKKLTHPSGFPYKHQSPDYELLVTFEFFTGFCGSAIGLAFDSLLLVLLSLEEVQLSHLKKSLADIVNMIKVTSDGRMLTDDNVLQDAIGSKSHNELEHGDDSPSILENSHVEEVRKKLVVWITHHQQTIRYHEELRKIYYGPLCVQFTNIVLNVCLLLFLLALGVFTVTETVFFFIFFAGNYGLFYLTCKSGDQINTLSGLIFEEAFSKAWYVYPQPIKSLLHIIIMRSQKPLDVVAFDIYPLGTRSFFKIFKTSYTFFTFMLQAIKKNKSL